jgi:hypothetical protein
MTRNSNQFLVLLIDFDKKQERITIVKSKIPSALVDRVFVLGVWSEPEALKTALGSYEEIGSKIARDCRQEIDTACNHELLRHNIAELKRLRQRVRAILFGCASSAHFPNSWFFRTCGQHVRDTPI